MKKYIAVILAVLILGTSLVGCTKSSVETGSNDKEKLEAAVEVVSSFERLLSENKKANELLSYLSDNIVKLDEAQATQLLGKLISLVEAAEYQYNEEFYSGDKQELMLKYFYEGFDIEKLKLVKEEGLKSFLEELIGGGYKIITIEGSYMAIVDFESFKKFNEYIDEELKEYIGIMAVQSNQPMAIDASVTISWDEVVERIVSMEDYLRKHKTETRTGIMKEVYTGSIMAYLSGMDNSPVFDYATEVLLEEMHTHYENTLKKYKDKYIASILKEYLTMLDEEGYMYTERVQDFIMNINEAVDRTIK